MTASLPLLCLLALECAIIFALRMRRNGDGPFARAFAPSSRFWAREYNRQSCQP